MVYKVTTEYFQEDPELVQKFRHLSRDHWTDHVWRHRAYLVSSLAELPDFDTALDWSYKNDNAIAATIAKYYGDNYAQKFVEIMSRWTGTMASMLTYLKKPPANFNANTDAYFLELKKRWEDEIMSIADLLSTMNPSYWNKTVMEKIFSSLVDLWMMQIANRISKNWTQDLEALDKSFALARDIADLFADGTIQQNLDKFSKV